jgi:flavin-dependent dehydrogenase
MYDAIVVGARCAGSPTAMLLARKGYRVLLVDKASFPSDILNGYYLQQPAVVRMRSWGLLDQLRATNCPDLRTLTFDFGDYVLRGSPPPSADIFEGYAPRRSVLDKILVDAAVGSGVELREGFAVDGLCWEGDRVTGIRSRSKAGVSMTEQARIVIGADGTSSVVARSANAELYQAKPALTCWYFTHWSGVPVEGIEFYLRERRALVACHTNDGLTVVLAACPHDEFFEFRTNIERNYFASLDLAPAFAERVRGGKQEERFAGTADTANFFRRPFGLGWALVGDAGYHRDPATAQGIADSFRDAELLSEAIDDGFCGRRSLADSLAAYEEQRNAAAMPMYEFTAQLANLSEPPSPETQGLLRALHGNQPETGRFLGAWAGTVPIPEFFAPENLQRIIAAKGQSIC